MKLTKITALMLAAITSLTTSAASQANTERWFEVEVILFNQLGDKNLLKEQFPDSESMAPMPKYRKTIDLLSPYLQPDISAQKHLLPLCDGYQEADFSFRAQTPKLGFIQLQSLIALQKLVDEELSAYQTPESALDATQFTQENNENFQGANTEGSTAEDSAKGALSADDLSTEQYANEFEDDLNYQSQLTPEQIALIAQAEADFSPVQFNYSGDFAWQSKNKLCRIPASVFADYQKQSLTNETIVFDYYGIKHSTMPKTIDSIEDVFSDSPYLISRESLQLHDIVTSLKRSRNFQPLLHLGWRLAPQGKKRAEAYHIYGGENLIYHYEKQQEKYADALEAIAQKELNARQENALNESFSDAQSVSTPTFEQLNEENKGEALNAAFKQKLAEIIEQLDSVDESSMAEITASLDQPSKPFPLLVDEEKREEINKPEAPIQPWFLDGLFRVHLNHYLYITADFTVMDSTLAQQATQALTPALTSADANQSKPAKAIRFEQNRRVISGEIHYFDHPYIGMFVQIRKHKRPEKTEENETTSAN